MTLAEPLGAETIVHFAAKALSAREEATPDADEFTSHLTARLDGRSMVSAGDGIRLAVDVDRMHFFDPEGEGAIA